MEVSFFLLMVIYLSFFLYSSSAFSEIPPSDNATNIADIAMGHPSPSPGKPNLSPFRPSIAVVVGVLTTMFSITFLLLLYAKHCKRGTLVVVGYGAQYPTSGTLPISNTRKNSGIERSVIESLPVFRFGSLTGQKDGLECAVCLSRFESSEFLRLLPKCKHAFHVECVDTWLDAHSTCPLCRYRVDPEDILLVENHLLPPPPLQENDAVSNIEIRANTANESNPEFRRVQGRHSSAGERRTGFLQIVVQKQGETGSTNPTSFRRSIDSWSLIRKSSDSVPVGCFDRSRKDGLLLTHEKKNTLDRSRLKHRIIVSPRGGGLHQRWSDVQPSDLLYLRSEMIISDSRRFSSASGSRLSAMTRQTLQEDHERRKSETSINEMRWSGRDVINLRSVSEITGFSRFQNDNGRVDNDIDRTRQGHAGLVSRWLAWVSQLRPAVRSGRAISQ
ncbi:hypothetical protein UlMin_005055 [Ulmus minor]